MPVFLLQYKLSVMFVCSFCPAISTICALLSRRGHSSPRPSCHQPLCTHFRNWGFHKLWRILHALKALNSVKLIWCLPSVPWTMTQARSSHMSVTPVHLLRPESKWLAFWATWPRDQTCPHRQAGWAGTDSGQFVFRRFHWSTIYTIIVFSSNNILSFAVFKMPCYLCYILEPLPIFPSRGANPEHCRCRAGVNMTLPPSAPKLFRCEAKNTTMLSTHCKSFK